MNIPAVKKSRTKPGPTPLPGPDREQIIAAIARHGRPAVIREFMRFDPYRERHSADAMIRNLERTAEYSFASSSLNLFRDLAAHYRAERLKHQPAPVTPPPGSRRAACSATTSAGGA